MSSRHRKKGQNSRTNPMRIYETNYHLIMELVPELLVNANYRYYYYGGKAKLLLDVVDTSAYTQELKLQHELQEVPTFMPEICLDVRVYHGAWCR